MLEFIAEHHRGVTLLPGPSGPLLPLSLDFIRIGFFDDTTGPASVVSPASSAHSPAAPNTPAFSDCLARQPNSRATYRMLMPSTCTALLTRAYTSTLNTSQVSRKRHHVLNV